jgi:hypothetical protein
MGGKWLLNLISTTLPRTPATAPAFFSLISLFILALISALSAFFAAEHLPQSPCIFLYNSKVMFLLTISALP